MINRMLSKRMAASVTAKCGPAGRCGIDIPFYAKFATFSIIVPTDFDTNLYL